MNTFKRNTSSPFQVGPYPATSITAKEPIKFTGKSSKQTEMEYFKAHYPEETGDLASFKVKQLSAISSEFGAGLNDLLRFIEGPKSIGTRSLGILFVCPIEQKIKLLGKCLARRKETAECHHTFSELLAGCLEAEQFRLKQVLKFCLNRDAICLCDIEKLAKDLRAAFRNLDEAVLSCHKPHLTQSRTPPAVEPKPMFERIEDLINAKVAELRKTSGQFIQSRKPDKWDSLIKYNQTLRRYEFNESPIFDQSINILAGDDSAAAHPAAAMIPTRHDQLMVHPGLPGTGSSASG